MPCQTRRPSFDGKLERHLFFGTSSNLPRIIEVELTNLRPNPDQPRTAFDPALIQELADSIQQHGIIQPIAVEFITVYVLWYAVPPLKGGTPYGQCTIR